MSWQSYHHLCMNGNQDVKPRRKYTKDVYYSSTSLQMVVSGDNEPPICFDHKHANTDVIKEKVVQYVHESVMTPQNFFRSSKEYRVTVPLLLLFSLVTLVFHGQLCGYAAKPSHLHCLNFCLQFWHRPLAPGSWGHRHPKHVNFNGWNVQMLKC